MKFLIFSLFAVSICCSLFAKNYSTKIYLCSSSVDEFQKEINSTSQDIVDRLKGDVVCSFDISDNQKVKFSKESFLQKHKEGKKLSETNSIELSKDLPEFGIELSAYCRNLKGSGKIAIELDFLYSELIGFIEFVRCLTKKNRYNTGMRIIGISSTAGLRGSKAHLAYSASKAGMNGAMRCMAVELAAKGITANTIAPGMIDTDMYKKFLNDNGYESQANIGLLARQYLGIGKTDDVAAVIAFLLAPVSRFITGVCIPVDGGLTSC